MKQSCGSLFVTVKSYDFFNDIESRDKVNYMQSYLVIIITLEPFDRDTIILSGSNPPPTPH